MPTPTKIGPYEIIRKFDSLGLSEVYLARDPSDDGQVAIKRLREQDLDNPEVRFRFEREARILRKLENAPIVPIYKFEEHDDRPYIVMRYMDGGTLWERINGNPLPLDQIIPIIKRVAKALDLAHQNKVIHRDLKPNNILFDENGDAFLSDFGLSKQLDASAPITQSDRTIGTPLYMSPEQIRDPRNVDHSSDIFSLAMILYEMLTGKHPFADAQDLSNHFSVMHAIINNDVPKLTDDELERIGLPPACNNILQKAMAKDRNKRYEKASDLARDLTLLQNSASTVPYKYPSDPSSLIKIPIYWFARKLDNQIYGGVANEFQFKKLLPWSIPLILTILLLGSTITITLNMYLPQIFSSYPLATRTSTITVTPTSTLIQTPTLTPTLPPTYLANIVQPSRCYNGPDEQYPVATILPANITVDVLGTIEDTADWFMVQGSSFDRCWITASALSFDEGTIDFNEILLFITVTTLSDSTCYIGPASDYDEQTLIPMGWRIVTYGRNDIEGDWINVVPHDSTKQCWVARDLLTNFNSENLPIDLAHHLVADTTNAIPIPQLEITWEIVNFDCSNGKATGAKIDLKVDGGRPPYIYSHTLPLYAVPEEFLSITVKSDTSDGQPSQTINFTVPKSNDTSWFDCTKPGTNPGPINPPTPIPPPTPISPTPTLCWPPGQCKNK